MVQVLITLVLSLTVSVSAWAGNWNKTKAPYEFIEIDGQIPLHKNI